MPTNNPFDDGNEDANIHRIHSSSDMKSSENIALSRTNSSHESGNLIVDDDNIDDDEPPASAAASWQYLKDLPYRQVPIYTNVHWEAPEKSTSHNTDGNPADNADGNKDGSGNHQQTTVNRWYNPGLAHYPWTSATRDWSDSLWHRSTTTKVVGCPLGGLVCRVTIPLSQSSAASITTTHLLVSSNAGTLLHAIPFPPRNLLHDGYTAASVLAIGFTSRQVLIVVLQDSLCLCYSVHEGYRNNNNIANSDQKNALPDPSTDRLLFDPFFALGTPQPLAAATVYSGGCVCLAAQTQAVALVELADDNDIIMVRPPPSHAVRGTGPPDASAYAAPRATAWVTPLNQTERYGVQHNLQFLALAVLPRECTSHGWPEVYLSTHDSSVVVVPAAPHSTVVDLDCRAQFQKTGNHKSNNTISHMRFAPNGRFLACFTTSGLLTVVSSNFDTHVVDFDTSKSTTSSSGGSANHANNNNSTPPIDMCWCGEDSVLLQWKTLGVLMVGPFADWLRFPYPDEEQVYLLPEGDGCRVVTATTVEWLQRVPPVCVDLLRMGSLHPGALLMDAATAFYAHNNNNRSTNNNSNRSSQHNQPNALATTRSLDRLQSQGSLVTAIRSCLEAATQELDIRTQKRLLRAASFGLQHNHSASTTQKNNINTEPSGMVGGPAHCDEDFDDDDDDDEDDTTNNYDESDDPIGEHKDGSPGPVNDDDNRLLPNRLTRKFVRAAQTLRILNALRHPNVGILMTMTQCASIGLEGVLARLVVHPNGGAALAAKIAQFANLSHTAQVYCRASQAAQFVTRQATAAAYSRLSHNDDDNSGGGNNNNAPRIMSDSQLAQTAMNIISGIPNAIEMAAATASSSGDAANATVNAPIQPPTTEDLNRNRGAYATVAQAATRAGRSGVANLLLRLETSVVDKVPALIASGNYSDAVAVATVKSDADLLFTTIMSYEKLVLAQSAAAGGGDFSKAQTNFYTTVVTKFTPEAFYTLRKYLQVLGDRQRSVNLDLRGQMFGLAGTDMALQAMRETDPREIVGMLTEASKTFGNGNSAFHKSCTDDYLSLRKDQDTLRKKYNADDIIPASATSSVSATIAAVIAFAARNQREQHRLFTDADKIAKKFRVPEKRLWHIKVKAFADSGQWSNLRLLAESRKPPIGFKPFARAAIDGGQSEAEVLRYVSGITDQEEVYDTLCYGQFWSKALDEAYKLRDERRIFNVKHLCNSAAVQQRADDLLQNLA